jgi:hypothetical protein
MDQGAFWLAEDEALGRAAAGDHHTEVTSFSGW